jgi:arginyl-tRNA synthetase
LAIQKFIDFEINKSIYIVDFAQILHFKQVFKTLSLLGIQSINTQGYKNISDNSYHLSYGQVILPEGKMSSRKGNVIYFSELKKLLNESIFNEFLSKKKEGGWSDEEIHHALNTISNATIKYGMLNQDPNTNITFQLNQWIEKTGFKLL